MKRKCAEINKKLGEKLDIPESELLATIEACQNMIKEGQDLRGGAGSSSAGERIIMEHE